MSRAQTLEILSGIIDRLEPVGDVGRGAPLRASDWNLMVDAVTSLARLVASREETLADQLEEGFAPAGHDHRGEATMDWFEADTRRLLEAAASGSADTRTGQQKIEKELASLNGTIREMRSETDALRLSLDQFRDADFARERSLGRIANDVESLGRISNSVDNLSARVTDLDEDIATVIDFRDQLNDSDGNQIDIGALQGRVSELEEIRGNLITADGELVRIREFESSIARLEQDQVNRDEIDALIVQRVNDGEIFENDGFLDEIAERVEATFDPRFGAVESILEARGREIDGLSGTIGPVTESVERLDVLTAQHSEQLIGLGSLDERIGSNAERIAALERSRDTIDPRLAATETLANRNSVRLDGFSATTVQSERNTADLREVSARADALSRSVLVLPDLTRRVTRLEQNGDSISPVVLDRLAPLEQADGALDTRIGVAEAELAAMDDAVGRLRTLERMDAEFNEWRSGVDRRIATLGTGGDTSESMDRRLAKLEENIADQRATLARLGEEMERMSQAVRERRLSDARGGGIIRRQ